MSIRDTATGALGVARLAFDAGAALIFVAVPVAFAIGEANSMAHTARTEIAPAGIPSDSERLPDVETVVELM
jgi:hypothetical protein